MAAPEYVPTSPTHQPRTYISPPRRPDEWQADRPAEVVGEPQPREEGRRGAQGPDQGYAIKLARHFADQLWLSPGESRDDAIAGAIAIGLKRASIFGRAPVVYDLELAFTLFGFVGEVPPAELVVARQKLFQGVGHPHHYERMRALVDAVPESTLKLSVADVSARVRSDWRTLLTT